jgi:hypothetical protein
VPRLSKILEKEKGEGDAVREPLETLQGTVDQLKELRLAFCHVDINARNVSPFQSIGARNRMTRMEREHLSKKTKSVPD